MLILYALARPLLTGTNTSEPLLASVADGSAAACDDIHGCRTVPAIIWSCVSVVFICTWVAIHPNVPRHGEHTSVVLLHNAGIMFMALIAPELIVLWAMRQWFSAQNIVKQFKKYPLSKTHAFFILMGGFALYEGDKFSHVLWEKGWGRADRELVEEIEKHRRQVDKSEQENTTSDITDKYECLLEYLLYHGYISVTQVEIQDRSHADVLSKTIAIVQTIWFILQSIARGAQGLGITELEIITLAFAFLNFITYFLWWNKPLRVRYPVRFTWYLGENLSPRVGENRAIPMPRLFAVKAEMAGIGQHIASGVRRPRKGTSRADRATLTSWIFSVKTEIVVAGKYIVSSFHAAWEEVADNYSEFAAVPLYPILPLLVSFGNILLGEDTSLFSSQLVSDPPKLYAAAYLIAVGFGALHCIAWSFEFPTEVEQLQWRIMSALVTVLPLSTGATHSIFHYERKVDDFFDRVAWRGLSKVIKVIFDFFVGITVLLLPILYITARIWLIVLALMALRDLPPSAYQAVQWLNFIPHIG
ncbi:hypothetical protein Moror_3459 [Moniliophthora roreri MCA 2997]|uniref:Uncharacterized protein n=2 Tax=Moniliophthora roreri TaxID=221103 RepID=V2X249_MONRO|nr:hypothetical protein Moror_3459 [Moniliophthora roreri MCA 2997]